MEPHLPAAAPQTQEDTAGFYKNRSLMAELTEQQAEDIIGYVAIAITAAGPVIRTNARDCPVIIKQLAEVISVLAGELAEGVDLMREARRT